MGLDVLMFSEWYNGNVMVLYGDGWYTDIYILNIYVYGENMTVF